MNYRIEPGCIVFTIDEDELAVLQHIHDDDPEHFDTDDVMMDWFEQVTCNDEFYWLNPAQTGDLTDAPMLGLVGQDQIMTHNPENGDGWLHTVSDGHNFWGCPILKRWAFMSYQVTTPQRQLLEKRECRWQGGDFMEEKAYSDVLEMHGPEADQPIEVTA